MDEASKQYTAFTVRNLGFFKCEWMPLGLCIAPHHLSKINAELPGRTEPNLLLNLFGWHDSLLKDEGGAHTMLVHCVWMFPEHSLKLKPTNVNTGMILIIWLIMSPRRGLRPSKESLKAVAQFALPQTYSEVWAFLWFMGHYQWFIKGLAHIVQPLHEDLSREGYHKNRLMVDIMW